MKRTENRCARKERRRKVRDVGYFILTHLGADPAKEVVGYGQSTVIGQSGIVLMQFEWYRGAVFVSIV